jgi:hypothetical protein
VAEQTAVCHVKSRVGAGAKKFSHGAWLKNKKGAQNKNKEISLKSDNFLFLFYRKEKQVASAVFCFFAKVISVSLF